MPTFNYEVDDEPQSTNEHTLTPNQILQKAKIDPTENYLVQIVGAKKESYQNSPDKEIPMHEHMKFVSVFTGQVGVS